MGADRAVHVQTGEGEAPEPLAVAKLLAAVGGAAPPARSGQHACCAVFSPTRSCLCCSARV